MITLTLLSFGPKCLCPPLKHCKKHDAYHGPDLEQAMDLKDKKLVGEGQTPAAPR